MSGLLKGLFSQCMGSCQTLVHVPIYSLSFCEPHTLFPLVLMSCDTGLILILQKDTLIPSKSPFTPVIRYTLKLAGRLLSYTFLLKTLTSPMSEMLDCFLKWTNSFLCISGPGTDTQFPNLFSVHLGTHFIAREVQQWAQDHGIHWSYPIFYHPEASGLIERWNGLWQT